MWHCKRLSNPAWLAFASMLAASYYRAQYSGIRLSHATLLHHITLRYFRAEECYVMLTCNRVGQDYSWRFILYCHHFNFFFSLFHKPPEWITVFTFTHPSDHVLCQANAGRMSVHGFQKRSSLEGDTFEPSDVAQYTILFHLKIQQFTNMELPLTRNLHHTHC